LWRDGQYVGSGFVLDTKRQVITFAHTIAHMKELRYMGAGFHSANHALHRLKIVKLFPFAALAVLQSDADLCSTPLQRNRE
jgi:hypothetical protein